jgi:hypothetical protein
MHLSVPMKTALLAALFTVAACSSTEYAYVPAQNATATMGGEAAAAYSIPPNAPAGDVRIATYGVAELAPQNGDARHLDAIHLHLSVADNSDHPWSLDTRDQRLDLEGRGMSAPAFATADRSGQAPPLVTVAPGGKREVDLFFPIPGDMDGVSDLPAFDAIWRVNTGNQVVVERTPFERIALEAAPAYPPDYYAVDAWPYWYDPYYLGWGVVPPAYWGGRPFYVHHWGHPHFWHGGGGFHGGFHGGHGGGGHHR